LAAVAEGQPPDFLFGTNTDYYYGQWAETGRLVDLSVDAIGKRYGHRTAGVVTIQLEYPARAQVNGG
jgi:hypothetical protein